ncbi:antibiotic biosynthesis monooxygenase [bacterium]|nr:antibiotic biosynthesis monooxygenase [bacterium]
MIIVHVHIHVREDCIQAFIDASVENAGHSIREPGIVRFDLIRRQDDTQRFVLVEIYRSQEDTVKHKETAHYQKWRDTVADMMAEPRQGIRYDNVFPGDDAWH